MLFYVPLWNSRNIQWLWGQLNSLFQMCTYVFVFHWRLLIGRRWSLFCPKVLAGKAPFPHWSHLRLSGFRRVTQRMGGGWSRWGMLGHQWKIPELVAFLQCRQTGSFCVSFCVGWRDKGLSHGESWLANLLPQVRISSLIGFLVMVFQVSLSPCQPEVQSPLFWD